VKTPVLRWTPQQQQKNKKRCEGGGWREWGDKWGSIEVDGGVDGANRVIKVESRQGYGRNAEGFSQSISKITVVLIVVIVVTSIVEVV